MELTTEALTPLSDELAELEPLDILRVVHRAWGRRAAILTGMQLAGTALCHMADRAGLDFDVVFVDTGVLHVETLATRDRLVETHPRLRVVTLRPAQTFAEQTRERGVLYLSKEGQEQCCELRKSAPLAELRGRYDVLLGALRRDEGGRREKVAAIEIDPALGGLRVHPLVHVTMADLERYVREHTDVVVNPLHAMGYRTIGCFPCTTPVRPDENERAGRWRHLADVTYCGINPSDGVSARRAVTVSSAFEEFKAALAAARNPLLL
ncbi:MAG: phosphoadenylyl-sulfate reductase [Polyangiaceae bacterium]